MKSLEVWTCQRAENLKKKSSKIPNNNYAATMVSAARRQIIGGGGAPLNKSRRRRRPQNVGGGGAARPAHGSSVDYDNIITCEIMKHCLLNAIKMLSHIVSRDIKIDYLIGCAKYKR